MLPSYEKLNILSEKLRKSIIATMGLDENDQIFIGNEEKLFLFTLCRRIPDSNHPTRVKILD